MASRPGGGMETQMTRTPSNRRASRPARSTTAPFQVGHCTCRPVSGGIHLSVNTAQWAKISQCQSGQLGEQVGEVNDAQTVEQTRALLNLSPHLDGLAASKMDPQLLGFVFFFFKLIISFKLLFFCCIMRTWVRA